MFNPIEALVMFIPIIITLFLVITVLFFFIRLVRAVEKIADKMD